MLDDLSLYSDEFIESQYKYYDSLRPRHHVVREAGTVYQLRDQFKHELNRRAKNAQNNS